MALALYETQSAARREAERFSERGLREVSIGELVTPQFRRKFIDCYLTVFGQHPWNQFLQCRTPDCPRPAYSLQEAYGVQDKVADYRALRTRPLILETCPGCGQESLSRYPLEEMAEETLHHVIAHNGTLVVFEDGEGAERTIRGFICGWPMSFHAFAAEVLDPQLHLDEHTIRRIRHRFPTALFQHDPHLLHIAEIGIEPGYRKGVSGVFTLIQAFNAAFRQRHSLRRLPSTVLWTMEGSSLHRITQATGLDDVFARVPAANDATLIAMRTETPRYFAFFDQAPRALLHGLRTVLKATRQARRDTSSTLATPTNALSDHNTTHQTI